MKMRSQVLIAVRMLRSPAIRARTVCLSLFLVLGTLTPALSPAASASPESYDKTMKFSAKDCQAVVRDLPGSARIDKYPGSSNLDKGQLVFGPPSKNPRTIVFRCFRQPFSEEMLSWALQSESTSPCYLPGHLPTGQQPGASRVCKPWGFTHVAGTNVDFYTAQTCAGGSRCGNVADYVRRLAGGFILCDPSQSSSSPVSWIVTMLEQSTFHVERGAGGNPYDPNHFFDQYRPQDWILPNYWLQS